MQKKYLNILIDDDLHMFFKIYATQNGTTMKDLMIEFIESLRRDKGGEQKEETEVLRKEA